MFFSVRISIEEALQQSVKISGEAEFQGSHIADENPGDPVLKFRPLSRLQAFALCWPCLLQESGRAGTLGGLEGWDLQRPW